MQHTVTGIKSWCYFITFPSIMPATQKKKLSKHKHNSDIPYSLARKSSTRNSQKDNCNRFQHNFEYIFCSSTLNIIAKKFLKLYRTCLKQS